MKLKTNILLLLLTLWLVPAKAHDYLGSLTLSDSASVCLVTCGPGNDFYTTFGHTAIRVADPAINLDKVYNYGTFNFNIPHFYLTFARGKLDYCLSRTEFAYFLMEYQYEGRSVYQQQLQLSPEEVNRIFRSLEDNYLEENRYYKYDFFRDNCATRVRDIIINNLDGKSAYSETTSDTNLTYRELLHRHTGNNLMWWQLGIDLLLGQRCDRPLSSFEYMFLPDDLMAQTDTATLGLTGEPLADAPQMLLAETRTPPTASFPPTLAFWFLFVVAASLTVIEWGRNAKTDSSLAKVKRINFTWFDAILFSLASLISLVLIFMWFGTDHYCTKANWNLLWANPLFIYMLARLRRPSRVIACLLAVVLLLTAIGFQLLPQRLNPALLPVVLTLFIRTLNKLRKHPRP